MGPADNMLATKEGRALKKKENDYNRLSRKSTP